MASKQLNPAAAEFIPGSFKSDTSNWGSLCEVSEVSIALAKDAWPLLLCKRLSGRTECNASNTLAEYPGSDSASTALGLVVPCSQRVLFCKLAPKAVIALTLSQF